MVRNDSRQSSSSPFCIENDEETFNIRRLITKAKWPQLRALLLTSEGRRAVQRATALRGPSDRSILHDLLTSDPPVNVVERMISILDAEHFTNRDASNFNCTPFLAGISNRANHLVLKKILQVHPIVATIADDRGVTPLMMECSMGRACQYNTVKLLVQTAPRHVMLEDADGQTALEYALFSDAIDIFRKLQRFHARELQRQSLVKAEQRRLRAEQQQQKKKHKTMEISTVTEELRESFSKLDGLAELRAQPRVSRSSAAA